MTALPEWVLEAAALPVAFAQVREDAFIDAWVVRQLPQNSRVIMVGSGGCTVAFLACCANVARIDVVDPNPAQIALARLKLQLLRDSDRADRLALLGHSAMPADLREERLTAVLGGIDLSLEALGPPDLTSTHGPDHTGRYEWVFVRLRNRLEPHAGELEHMLSLDDPDEQARCIAAGTPLDRALGRAFEDAMDLSALVHLFGEKATRNRVEPFATHFERRTREAIRTMPANDNPFLWQALVGRYPGGTEAPWLAMPAPPRLPVINWRTSFMIDALRQSRDEYDLVQLSNILDWLDEEEARATLNAAHEALRRGGSVLVRQLNSSLDIRRLDSNFAWRSDESKSLHVRDRSFFYRELHLGTKR